MDFEYLRSFRLEPLFVLNSRVHVRNVIKKNNVLQFVLYALPAENLDISNLKIMSRILPETTDIISLEFREDVGVYRLLCKQKYIFVLGARNNYTRHDSAKTADSGLRELDDKNSLVSQKLQIR